MNPLDNPSAANEELNVGPNLNDPACVAQLCLDHAQGVDQQARAASSRGTALAGHPYPEQFFTAVANTLRAAAALLGARVAAAPTPEVPDSWAPGTAAPEKKPAAAAAPAKK